MTLDAEQARMDADLRLFITQHYRWWTVFGWWEADARGVKLGPVSIGLFRTTRWDLCVTVLCGTPIVDTALRRLRS